MRPLFMVACAAISVAAAAYMTVVPNSARRVSLPYPVKLSDLPLSQQTRVVVAYTPTTPQVCQFPAEYGFALTEIGGVPNSYISSYGTATRLRIHVDGVPRASILFNMANEAISRYQFDPPLIVPAGGSFSLTWVGLPVEVYTPVGDAPEFTLAGWTILASEL
jgi:hypothetical protein